LAQPLPPWLRHLVLEVFRCRLAQDTAKRPVYLRTVCSFAPPRRSNVSPRAHSIKSELERETSRGLSLTLATTSLSLRQVSTDLPGILLPSDALRESSDCRGSQATTSSGCPGLAYSLQNHGLNREVASISALRALQLLPTDALPFLSVPRHVQVSSGRLTFVVSLSCDRSRTRPGFLASSRASLSRLPGLFHPGGIHGVFPFRGLTSSSARSPFG